MVCKELLLALLVLVTVFTTGLFSVGFGSRSGYSSSKENRQDGDSGSSCVPLTYFSLLSLLLEPLAFLFHRDGADVAPSCLSQRAYAASLTGS